MNLLFRVLFATGCRSTHHKLAMDALRHLEGTDAQRWRRLFLAHHDDYLRGAKAPDKTFRDFRNHVLHVGDNNWGGAPVAARRWYERTVKALKSSNWPEAVYAAGVLTHYYSDPIQPCHTGQCEAETNIHRAVEWSITKSYLPLRQRVEQQIGLPRVDVPAGEDWIEAMVTAGAERAYEHYDSLIEDYDFDAGVSNPPAGLTEPCHDYLADLLGYAAVGIARILERAFDEARVIPPRTNLTLRLFVASLNIPIRWVTNKLADASDRETVKAMYDELQQTGRVLDTLSEDERTVSQLVAETTGGTSPSNEGRDSQPKSPTPPQPTVGSAPPPPSTKKPLRFYLELQENVVEAPSIGSKTASRLAGVGIRTVAELLAADPPETSQALGVRYITPELIGDWQAQAQLVCTIPRLRGHDAQILVACGYRQHSDVIGADPAELLTEVTEFASTHEGKRILRSSKAPNQAEIDDWIAWARQARSPRAA